MDVARRGTLTGEHELLNTPFLYCIHGFENEKMTIPECDVRLIAVDLAITRGRMRKLIRPQHTR